MRREAAIGFVHSRGCNHGKQTEIDCLLCCQDVLDLMDGKQVDPCDRECRAGHSVSCDVRRSSMLRTDNFVSGDGNAFDQYGG